MTTVTCIPPKQNENSVVVKVCELIYTFEVGGAVSCSCSSFSVSILLCRHIIFTIHHLQKNFDSTRIPRQWTQAYNKMRTAAVQQVDVARVEAKNLSRTEKFRELNRVLKDTADVSADLGHTQFCQRYEIIAALHKAFQEGKVVFLNIQGVYV